MAPFLARLNYGVTLFFLLSGFLLYRPFAAAAVASGPHPRIGDFWWRRAVRIFPAYLLATVVTLAWLTVPRRSDTSTWWSYLTLTQTYTAHDTNASLQQMWTLAVEVSFYAVLPLVALAARRRFRRNEVRGQLCLIGLFVIVAVAWSVFAHARYGDITAVLLWLPGFLDWFALGMLLALARALPDTGHRWCQVLRQWAAYPGTCWLIGAILYWLSTLPLAGPRNLLPATGWEWFAQHWLFGSSAFFFLLPLMLGNSRWPNRLLGNRVMRWLGTISYGVYLWHLGILLTLQHLFGWRTFGGHFLPLFLLTAAAATLLAATSWYLLERPLLQRFGRTWRGARIDDRRSGQGEDNQPTDLERAAPVQ